MIHNALYTHARGKTVVTCSCGWIGTQVESVGAAQEQHRMHAEQARHYEASPKLEPVPWN